MATNARVYVGKWDQKCTLDGSIYYALTYMNEPLLPILFFKFLIWNLSESQECRELHFNGGMLKEYMTIDYKDKINGGKYWWQEGLIMSVERV